MNIAEYRRSETYRCLQSPESLQERGQIFSKAKMGKYFTGKVALHEYENLSEKSH